MLLESLIQSIKFVKGLAPAADRWNTNPSTDVVSMANYNNVCFLVHQAGGTTGTATFTVNCSASNAGGSPTAIPFRYAKGPTGAGASSDIMGALTEATAAGFTSTAAEDALYLIEVSASELTADKPYVFLTCTEAANDPVNGAVEIILYNPRYAGAVQPTSIA